MWRSGRTPHFQRVNGFDRPRMPLGTRARSRNCVTCVDSSIAARKSMRLEPPNGDAMHINAWAIPRSLLPSVVKQRNYRTNDQKRPWARQSIGARQGDLENREVRSGGRAERHVSRV